MTKLCIYDFQVVANMVCAIATLLMAIATFATIRISKKQFKELSLQTKENRFMSLLSCYKDARNQLSFPASKGFVIGYQALEEAVGYFQERFSKNDFAFHDANSFLRNRNTYYDSLITIILFVKATDQTVFLDQLKNTMCDSEKRWLSYLCQYGSQYEYHDFTRLKDILIENYINASLN